MAGFGVDGWIQIGLRFGVSAYPEHPGILNIYGECTMKWILIAAMAEMVAQGITPATGTTAEGKRLAGSNFMQVRVLPSTNLHTPTIIAQYETREDCEAYASNMLLGQSILLSKVRTNHAYVERTIGLGGRLEDEAKEYLGRDEERTPIYGTDPMFVAAQCIQISGPVE